MDEPCSALDPLATIRIEELMTELKSDYTIVVVTHNMQQAARVSDRTAFFTVDVTDEGPDRGSGRDGHDRPDLHRARRPAHRRLHHRPLRVSVHGSSILMACPAGVPLAAKRTLAAISRE